MEEIDANMGMSVLTPEHFLQRQISASTGTYRPLKIYFDMIDLRAGLKKAGLEHRITFYEKVFEVTGKRWESVLQVNDDHSEVFKQMKYYMDYYVPRNEHMQRMDFNFSGVDTDKYDMFIKVNMGTQVGSNVLAYAGPFVRHPKTQRPISGAAFLTPYGNEVTEAHDSPFMYSIDTMIHEFGHIFGFIGWDRYQPHNLGVANNKHIWKGPKTLALAREYYDCGSLEGVALQTKNGKVGGHFNEAVLGDELMTPMAEHNGGRTSVLTISLLEDTQWYKGDYTRAEHFTFNKGQGCNVSSGSSCPSPAACKAGTRGFITSDFKGVGTCGRSSAGCEKENKYSNRNCEVEAGWSTNFKKYGLGPHYGDNCAVVNTDFKFKYNGRGAYRYQGQNMPVYAFCSEDRSSYTLKYKGFSYDSTGNPTGKDA